MLYSLCHAQTDDKQKAFMSQKTIIEEAMQQHERELISLEADLRKQEDLLSYYQNYPIPSQLVL